MAGKAKGTRNAGRFISLCVGHSCHYSASRDHDTVSTPKNERRQANASTRLIPTSMQCTSLTRSEAGLKTGNVFNTDPGAKRQRSTPPTLPYWRLGGGGAAGGTVTAALFWLFLCRTEKDTRCLLRSQRFHPPFGLSNSGEAVLCAHSGKTHRRRNAPRIVLTES